LRRGCHRPDVFGAVIPDRVDPFGNGNNDEFRVDPVFDNILKCLDVLVFRIEPEIKDLRFQNDRHPVMNGLDGCTGLPGKDGAGSIGSRLLSIVIPGFPQSGKCKWIAVRQCQEHRLFLPVGLFPFVKTIGEDQASAFPERSSESGFGCNGFIPCVDHPASDGFILCPERYESPVKFLQVVLVVMPGNGRNLLSGSNVVVGCDFDRFRVDGKVFSQRFELAGYNESAAHVSCRLSSSSAFRSN